MAPKIKYCSTIDEYAIVQENKLFKGFNNSKRLLLCSEYSKMIDGKKISAILPISKKKLFNSGVIVPTKIRFFTECNKDKYCDRCDNQITENEKFEDNMNLLKGNFLTNLVICFLILRIK